MRIHALGSRIGYDATTIKTSMDVSVFFSTPFFLFHSFVNLWCWSPFVRFYIFSLTTFTTIRHLSTPHHSSSYFSYIPTQLIPGLNDALLHIHCSHSTRCLSFPPG
ncbi:hypothetical protein K474DRAFT_1097834 [Panus rudis PR-1116 ss-1]|nr:hypothetical protein K474DRAFT_1097834 [Panus rudis PR-1116 ss-1]